MKSIVKAVAIAAVMVAPALSFAQSDSSVTRAQVKQDLQQVEAAGYDPSKDDQTTYPNDVQAAESRMHQQNGARPNYNNDYGGMNNGTAASGMRGMPMRNNDGTKGVYFGH